MDLLEKFAPPQKKKTLVLTNVGKRVVGGYIPVGSMYLKNSKPSIPGIIREEHTCLHSKPAGKGRRNKKKKKPWAARQKRAGKKKTPGINPGQVQRLHSEPAGKGRRRKKKKKNPGINHGQPAGKGREKKPWY
jgi:hypothetical protein